jgi:hypothetical protein
MKVSVRGLVGLLHNDPSFCGLGGLAALTLPSAASPTAFRLAAFGEAQQDRQVRVPEVLGEHVLAVALGSVGEELVVVGNDLACARVTREVGGRERHAATHFGRTHISADAGPRQSGPLLADGGNAAAFAPDENARAAIGVDPQQRIREYFLERRGDR